jgi:putative transcriptional regulator
MAGQDGYLSGRFLIATQNITGSGFRKSVVLLCAHSEEGAMGIIVNHILDNVDSTELFSQLNLDTGILQEPHPLYYGGPVEVNRGFVIYPKGDEPCDSELLSVGDIAVSSSIDILKRIAEGQGPEKYIIALGYAGWSPGQLEEEIQSNSWISVPSSSDIIFDYHNQEKWELAASLSGLDIHKLSTTAGHA